MTASGDLHADVVIVGGGLAGLTCGVALAGSGQSVLLLEESDFLGGRAASWTDKTTGDPVHIGPHIFLTEYVNMLKLLDMLGTRDRVVWQTDDGFLTRVHGTEEVLIEQRNLPPPLHLIPSVFADRTTPTPDKLSNFPLTFYAMHLTEEDMLRLDHVPAGQFLREMGVTQSYIDSFWSFTCLAIMNIPIEECSTGALLRFYKRLIGHRVFKPGFADRGLGDVFAPEAQAKIEAAGGKVLTGTKVKRFLGDARSATGVELADGRVVHARTCVAALPPQALHALAAPAWLETYGWFRDFAKLEPCPYISPYIWFDRKLTKRQFWARAYHPDDLSCDFYDLSNIYRGWEGRNSCITSNIIYSKRADSLSDEEIVKRTVAEISEYLPEAAKAKVVHSVIHRIPMAIHCPFVGTENIRPPVSSEIRGLLLAGDWIKTGLPSSMEGACMAGFQAAERIWQDIGKPRQLAVAHRETEGFVGLLTKMPGWVPTKYLGRSFARSVGRVLQLSKRD